MKASHLFWGSLFVVLGILVLLNNLNPIYLDWNTLWKFWPLALILIGAAIIIKHNTGKAALAVIAGIVVAFTGFATFKSVVHIFSEDFDVVIGSDERKFLLTEYYESYDDSIQTAHLKFSAGAGSFKLSGSTDSLFYAEVKGKDDPYSLNRFDDLTETELKFDMKDVKFNIGKTKYLNKVKMKLNPNPVWDLDIDVGAAGLDFDLTEYKINSLDLDVGAAGIKLKLGLPIEETYVKIDAGASGIEIWVPKESGCQIKSDVALSSKDYHGFKKVRSGLYQTPNFDDAEKKIKMDIDCGVSSIEVSRY